MNFIKQNWKQALTIAASIGVGLALHYGKITADQAVLVGALLAGVGIHLPPVAYSGGAPALGAKK